MTKQELNFVISKPEMHLIICTECWCVTDELVEFWSVEINIFKEHGQKLVKSRGIDLGHEALQVFADSFELVLPWLGSARLRLGFRWLRQEMAR